MRLGNNGETWLNTQRRTAIGGSPSPVPLSLHRLRSLFSLSLSFASPSPPSLVSLRPLARGRTVLTPLDPSPGPSHLCTSPSDVPKPHLVRSGAFAAIFCDRRWEFLHTACTIQVQVGPGHRGSEARCTPRSEARRRIRGRLRWKVEVSERGCLVLREESL